VASSALEEQGFGNRAKLYRGSYSAMSAFAAQVGWSAVDGILLDIGVSSPQIDDPARGFSYRQDGPLDMRMDTRSPISAASLLNTESEQELKRIFRKYGEERKAGAVARAVVRRRESKPWERTGEFAELLDAVAWRRRGGPPAPACCFQALRIAVNDELGELERGLRAAVSLLRPGGRVVAISFHSLEDRIIKHFFRDEAITCVCPPDCPMCICDKVATLKVITRRPVRAGEEELSRNRRASSAKMRVAERLPAEESNIRVRN